MLKSILVGLDGSPHSTVATDLGIRWAKKFDALLVGLGIIDEPTIRTAQAIPLGAGYYKRQRDAALIADARRKVEQFLERFTQRCAQAGVAFKLLEEIGLPAEEIVREAQRYDLILLGRQTYFHFETTEGPDATLFDVLKHGPRPVVTVPSSLGEGKNVAVAYDGSLQAARTIQAFQNTGLDEGRKIDVLSIAPTHMEAARHADRATEFLRLHDLDAESHPIASTASPAKVLLERVRDLDPAILVMGAYGQPTWREFFFGSVTRTLLQHSPVTLFLYH